MPQPPGELVRHGVVDADDRVVADRHQGERPEFAGDAGADYAAVTSINIRLTPSRHTDIPIIPQQKSNL